MSADESITSLSEAVASQGALPMPAGPAPQAVRRSAAETRLEQYGSERKTYGNGSEKALHHIALDLRKELSDQRAYERRLREQHDLDVAELNRLRAQVADLLAERHSTNEALDDAVQELDARRARITELEAELADAVDVSETLNRALMDEKLAGSALYSALTMPTTAEERQAALGRFLAVAERSGQLHAPSERPVNGLTAVFSPVASLREPEGEFHGALHHDYRVSHDLPETGGQR